jgi:hypothetical protein
MLPALILLTLTALVYAAPYVPPLPSGWLYMGCYQDEEDTLLGDQREFSHAYFQAGYGALMEQADAHLAWR